jgi:hypothetical protein
MTSTNFSIPMTSNGRDALFGSITPFSDNDPIWMGLLDGTLSWADAAELEEAEGRYAAAAAAASAAAKAMPVAPFTPPGSSAWFTPAVRQVAGGSWRDAIIAPISPITPSIIATPVTTPATPPRPARAVVCPGAPARPARVTNTTPCKTIILRNLPRDCEDLETALQLTFMRYTSLKDIYIPKNVDTSSPYFGTIKGFALIKFGQLSDSVAAYNAALAPVLATGSGSSGSSSGTFKLGRNYVSVEYAKEDR